MYPCNECAKLLIQAGVAEVVFHEGKGSAAAAGGDSDHDHEHGHEHGGRDGGGGGPAAGDGGAGQRMLGTGGGGDPCYRASRLLLEMAGVRTRQHRLGFPVTILPT